MAWITPKYDRASTETRTNATDMNRIVNNMAELGGTPIKSTYGSSDIVLVDEWEAIIGFIRPHNERINESSRYDNLNAIEYMMKRLHDGNAWSYWESQGWGDYTPTTWGDHRTSAWGTSWTWEQLQYMTWSDILGGE